MDIERGNLEILFQKIPYMYVIQKDDSLHRCCAYNKIAENLYMRYAADVFPYATDDERRNSYRYMCEQMQWKERKEGNIFFLIFDLAKRMLRLDGEEVECKFDQLLRWREISLKMGQDFFTCAYLAQKDWENGGRTQKFSWLPIIRSDNIRLHNILEKGLAENHFHLNGSTKIFELNWLCVMNHIAGRTKDFKQIKRTMQRQSGDSFDYWGEKEKFYTECQRAALYRIYLFSCLKRDEYLIKRTEKLIQMLPKGTETKNRAETELLALTPELQDLIIIAGNIYGAVINGDVLDYALEKSMMQYNDNVCRLLAGERKFLYECYRSVLANIFTDEQKNIFYAYLIIRTDFRGEVIQNNDKIGFANFSDYQDRKEYFIEGHKVYEDELVQLALNETLIKKNMISLEARICPKDTSAKLYGSLKNYEKLVKKGTSEDTYEKLIYVFHFPKVKDNGFSEGRPRNYNVRVKSRKQARSIVAMLEKKREINCHVKGIDACSSEIACRPEVFGQVFRYLSDIRIVSECVFNQAVNTARIPQNLRITYHVGEDFLDLVDGLRAIDETILFCNLNRGDRLGHALALGIEPQNYYCMKGNKVIIAKQVLLDDVVWMYCKANELGCHIGEQLKTELIETYYQLYKEIYENNIREEVCPSVHEYYQGWKLRGDNPEIYKLNEVQFKSVIVRTELLKFDRYQLNPRVSNEVRRNRKYQRLYELYHYNEAVRKEGDKITEFKIHKEYINLVRQIQEQMMQELACKGIGIETNPSSNYLIGTIKKYEEHPILRFNSRKLKQTNGKNHLSVSINTDDQGVFDTLLENEYGLMALALKKATDEDLNTLYDIEDIYEWIDYVRSMGVNQVF